jgi:hypothetical protein
VSFQVVIESITGPKLVGPKSITGPKWALQDPKSIMGRTKMCLNSSRHILDEQMDILEKGAGNNKDPWLNYLVFNVDCFPGPTPKHTKLDNIR